MIARYVNDLHENPVQPGDVELAGDDVSCSGPAMAGKPGLLKVEKL